MASAEPLTVVYRSRPATWADLDGVAEIERLSFPIPWRREFFEAELGERNRYHRVLESTGPNAAGIAAYVFAIVLPGEFHINKIASHPEVRRQGLGKRLMADALEEARRSGADSAALEVRVSNEPALAFYRSFGFAEAYRRARYYLDGEDALVLIRPILDLPLPPR